MGFYRWNKAILFFIFVTLGLSASADYSYTTTQPLYPQQVAQYPYSPYQQYPQYSPYQGLNPTQTNQVVQPTTIQPYAQTYNQGCYPNPYNAQYQAQGVNPYLYRQPYGYGNNLPAAVLGSTASGLGSTGGASSVMKNIVQQVLYSKMRGY